MKRILHCSFNLLLLAVFMASTVFALGHRDYTAPGPLAAVTIFAVQKGQGVSAIAENLAAQGIIARPQLFKAAARFESVQSKLHAGEYEFAAGVSMREVLGAMAEGRVYQRRLTVPEGLTSWQVAELVRAVPALSGDITEVPPEGTLLPETYTYMNGESRQAVLDRMRQAMTDALTDVWQARPRGGPLLSQSEAVILASIIEKETAVPDERRRISGVFHNRLKQGMKLQTDPTVIYAITAGKIQNEGQGPLGRRLLAADLQFDSPYNTYKYPGLPPGPIANPGRAALEAALDPESHGYLYFVADGTGGHVFASTLDDHNANAAQWRQIRRQQRN